jgi:hypothetical protein
MAAPPRISRVEISRTQTREGGTWETCMFSFPAHRRPNFIQPQNMPEEVREHDWRYAWYEVAKINGVWRGLRRMAQKSGPEEWTPESPDHAATGGTVHRPGRGHSAGVLRVPPPPGKIKRLGSAPLIGPMTFGQFLADGIALEVTCWCGREPVYMSGEELVRDHGADATVDQIDSRLMCSCGRRWPSITAVVVGWREGDSVPWTPQWPPKRRREPDWPNG